MFNSLLETLYCFVLMCGDAFDFFFFCLFAFSGAALAAYGSSQARGRIGAIAAGLCHSHSNARIKPNLQPTLQFMVTSDL